MPYTSAKAEAVLDVGLSTARALVMYLTREWTLEQLEELIDSARWDEAADELEAMAATRLLGAGGRAGRCVTPSGPRSRGQVPGLVRPIARSR